MTDTKTYVATKLAPPRVAGRRMKPGEELKLTEAEARSELRASHIVKKDGKADPENPFGKPTAKLAEIQARARGEVKPAAPPEDQSGSDGAEEESVGVEARDDAGGGDARAGDEGAGGRSRKGRSKAD